MFLKLSTWNTDTDEMEYRKVASVIGYLKMKGKSLLECARVLQKGLQCAIEGEGKI